MGEAQIVMKSRHLGVDLDGAANQLDCGRRLAALVGQQPQEMECVRLVGPYLENASIGGFGLGQPAGLVRLDGLLESLTRRVARSRGSLAATIAAVHWGPRVTGRHRRRVR